MTIVTCEACGEEHACREMGTYYTILLPDVGRKTIRAFGRPWLVADFMVSISNADIGRRLYRIHVPTRNADFLQAESEEEREKREAT